MLVAIVAVRVQVSYSVNKVDCSFK